MTAATAPDDSPFGTPIQPMHNPAQAAQVTVPQAPLGSVQNRMPGMGAKALLAKKMVNSHNRAFVSPTDNLLTPVTQKLNAVKKKHFAKETKPVQLFAQVQVPKSLSEDQLKLTDGKTSVVTTQLEADEENPF